MEVERPVVLSILNYRMHVIFAYVLSAQRKRKFKLYFFNYYNYWTVFNLNPDLLQEVFLKFQRFLELQKVLYCTKPILHNSPWIRYLSSNAAAAAYQLDWPRVF